MASITIHQRTRENQIVKTYTFTTGIFTAPFVGLTYDGKYLWASSIGTLIGAGVLAQLDLGSSAVAYENNVNLAVKQNIYDIAFNGELFQGITGTGPGGLSAYLINRSSQVVSPATALNANSNGICFDGEFYWILRVTTFFTPQSTLEQWAPDSAGGLVLVKSVVLGDEFEFGGLAFDGEFLITHPKMPGAGNLDIYFFDRSGTRVLTRTGEAVGATYTDGIAFDGEFFYTMASVGD